MYPDEFDYYEAGSVGEALDLLEEHADREAELIAGGHSLLPTMKTGLASPDVLIDVAQIDSLQGIEDRGDTVSIGAMTTYATVADSDVTLAAAPALAEAAHAVGDRQVRNMGTVGGNVAHADPASDLPGAAIASNATMVAEGRGGERKIAVDEFFDGMYETALADDELLIRIEVPAARSAVGAYAKKASPSSGYAMVGVAALLEVDGGVVRSASIGANGAMDRAVRLDPVEDELTGDSLDDDVVAAAASRATDDLDTAMMLSDVQASAEFRAQLLEVYTQRALEAVADEARAAAPADD